MEKKITIAIDGHSSTGKSTIAKALAKHLSYAYIDTGAMYRAITLYAMNNGIISENGINQSALIAALPNIKLEFKYNPTQGFSEIYLNEICVENEIRTLNVSNHVSKIAEIDAVRTQLVKQQQLMGNGKGVVMDGRDIGTVVFPDAELKLYMTANAQVRAQRRFDELQQKGEDASFESVYRNISERDYIDSNRANSPLVKAATAIELDNSNLSQKQQLEMVLNYISQIINS